MSDHFLWDALSQKVSGNDVLISTAYPMEKEEDYSEVTLVQQKTMKHFSEDIPGIPYPYPSFTTFIGLRGGGMEFPMMANNDGPGEGVTIHEMFHTYFPMYVRINERRFAWMDEGWADFITALVTHKYFSDEDNTASFYSSFKFGMQGSIGTIGDLPAVTSSQYMGNNYGYHSYALPGFTYALLYQHLGEEKFLEVFQEMEKRDVCLEINTSSLRRCFNDLHPCPEVLTWANNFNLNYSFASDAHEPRFVGFGYQEALSCLTEYQLQNMVLFRQRKAVKILKKHLNSFGT
jgi:hypothetical protein